MARSTAAGSAAASRDAALLLMRRVAAGGAIAGLTLTGALTGLMVRADVAAKAAEAPANHAATSAGTLMPRKVVVVVEEPRRQVLRAGATAAGAARQVTRPAPRTAQRPAVRAPQKAVAPAATSSGSTSR